ncbi:MAG: family 16 glycosylhydrolase, partial [Clostridia bacterium]|nr:family 16 glycosylhydrolase [Clostridia bacterium]
MKKLTSLLLLISLVCTCLSGIAFTASADSLDRAMNTAKPELYGMYTTQSGNVLRDIYDRAAAVKASGGTDIDLIVSLNKAVSGLVPLESYTRTELGGFDVSETDLAAMKLNSGSVSVSGGFVTLSGEGTLRYCNAVRNGIAGTSPFGAALGNCDGIAIKINSAAAASLDLEAGVRGSENDRVFTIPDIAVSAGERYYLFPFSRFGDLPLDGSLNYISLTFTGTSEVAFGDLHAVSGMLDGANLSAPEETPVTPAELNGVTFCRILQKDTDLALTMLSPKENGDSCCVFRKTDPDDDAQLWLLCRDSASGMSVRIINKHYAFALRGADSYITAARTDLTAPDQVWSFSYNNSRGYSFKSDGALRLSYFNGSVRLTPVSSAIKYFDIVSAGEQEWTTAWSDEFDGSSIDRTVWNVRDGVVSGGENAYAFRDSEENVYVENGNLVIHTFEGEYRGRPATSGHVSTEDNVQFGYGRYEFRVKMPEGQGIFPAL